MNKEKCHFIGIGGIGMSGLARLLRTRNIAVSGSDAHASYLTEQLSQEGITVYIGHAADQVPKESTVVYTTGIDKENPEYRAAIDLQCDIIHRSDLLAHLSKGYKSLAVTGTHGKTTTSALLSWILLQGGASPSFAIGGHLSSMCTNARYGDGDYFVIEACESDGTFLKYDPYGAIITNIDGDHLDFFNSESSLHRAFNDFIANVTSPDHLFWCGDDHQLSALCPRGVSYGFANRCSLRITRFEQSNWRSYLEIQYQNKTYSDIELPLLGKHNALNGAAAFGLAINLGINEESIRKAMASFAGVMRRCELKGEWRGISFIDDYAHHPTEIQTTLQGIRTAIGDRRLIAICQPHRYTRTRNTLAKYGGVFAAADLTILTDIYSAGEEAIAGITVQHLQAQLRQGSRYIPRDQLLGEIASLLQPRDVLVTLGAGDLAVLGEQLIAHMQSSP